MTQEPLIYSRRESVGSVESGEGVERVRESDLRPVQAGNPGGNVVEAEQYDGAHLSRRLCGGHRSVQRVGAIDLW